MPTAAKGPTSPREAKPKFLVCPLFSTHKHFCMAQANVFNWAFKALRMILFGLIHESAFRLYRVRSEHL